MHDAHISGDIVALNFVSGSNRSRLARIGTMAVNFQLMKPISPGRMSSAPAATIVSVAKGAGVSPATVSRFLRGNSVRNADTIRAAIETLGYRPTLAARSLRSGVHYAVAMIVPDIVNPYFASLAKGVESVFRGTQYRVFLCNTDEQSAIEDEV